ncbi:MAG: SMC-Scp complex subunit ScpB [Aliifodinibius sp.]|nr:SMC-Scp complex subunit ScpB [Fodinibius sp.]
MSDTKEKSIKDVNLLSTASKVEALLFVSPSYTHPKQIADALNVPVSEIQKALTTLEKQYQSRGIRLQENKGRYQLTTAPELSAEVEIFLQLEGTSRFSLAALETLAILAYQQPITRPAIDAIRGVNSDSVIRNLLSKGLIEELGRSEGPGRPILYGTSPEFLQYFGLSSIKDLPKIDLDLQKYQIKNTQSADQPELPLDNHLLKE